MSREAWRIDGELHGHTVEQTLAYLADVADFEDQQAGRWRSLPDGVISPDCEPRWLGRLRCWTGRG
jgi:hypothetical protein